MELLAIKKTDLPELIEAITRRYELIGPKAKEFRYAFGKVRSYSELALDYDYTLLPPKGFVMPQIEPLFTYDREFGVNLHRPADEPRRVIFGAHACDINGMWLIDDVMAEGNPDMHYLTRRAGTLVVGIGCEAACSSNSFCRSMGTHRPAGGYDLFLTSLDELYVVQVGSGRAGELIDLGKFFLAGYTLRESYYKKLAETESALPDRVGYNTARIPVLLAEAYDSLIWEALAESCFDCGACTVVCPTCYCFDVYDVPELDMSSGTRYRRWDSCQLTAFASVAGGGNFRGKRSDRIRHRLMRKGRYFKEKFGRFACVGCGRCGRACLVDIDVLDIFKRLKG